MKPFSSKPSRQQNRGKYFSTDWANKTKTLNELIIHEILSRNISCEDFVKYFNKNIKPRIETIQKEQRMAKQKQKKEFAEKKRIEALPENLLPNRFLSWKNKPEKLDTLAKENSLVDFLKVQKCAFDGKLDRILGAAKVDFQIWVNLVVESKQRSNSNRSGTLRKLVHPFR